MLSFLYVCLSRHPGGLRCYIIAIKDVHGVSGEVRLNSFCNVCYSGYHSEQSVFLLSDLKPAVIVDSC